MNNNKSAPHLVTDADIEAFARGGGPPYDGGMEARVAKLEDFAIETRERLARIETRLDTFATKEDLYKALNAQTWRVIGAATALVAAVYFVARYIH